MHTSVSLLQEHATSTKKTHELDKAIQAFVSHSQRKTSSAQPRTSHPPAAVEGGDVFPGFTINAGVQPGQLLTEEAANTVPTPSPAKVGVHSSVQQ